jgi:hypothetical protein
MSFLMTSGIVVDASIIVGLTLDGGQAIAIQERIRGCTHHAPHFIDLDVPIRIEFIE